MSEELTGRVKVYLEKGFGFIIPDDGRPDDFYHHSAVKASGLTEPLQPGDRIAYTLVPSVRYPKKFAAANIRLLERAVIEPEPDDAGIARLLKIEEPAT